MPMEKVDEDQWQIDQPGHLEIQENVVITNHPCCDHKEEINKEKPSDPPEEENDKKAPGEQQQQEEEEEEKEEEESSLPMTIPTYAPQEPREEEADDEDEGESSTTTNLHSWCSIPMPPPPYDSLESSESKSNDADDVLMDWTKEIPTEEKSVTRKAESPRIPSRTPAAFFECRRKQVAAFCERYRGPSPSVSLTSTPTVRQKFSTPNNFRAKPNQQYFGNQQRCNKRSFPHRFSGEEYCQRNTRRGFHLRHSDSATASCFHYHQEHQDSFSNYNSKRTQNVHRPSGFRPWNHNNNDSTPFQSTI